jgi:hypothetical protein
MKKIILSMVFVLGMITIGNANTTFEKINSIEESINPEDECRDGVSYTITFLYIYGNYSMQELADLETDLLIECFDQEL